MQTTAFQPPALIEASVKLRIVICAECGITFAIPLAFAGSLIHCPSGHFRQNHRTENSSSRDIHALLEENATLLHHVAVSEREVAQLGPVVLPEVDARELKRRCLIMQARAEATAYGRKLCVLCGGERAGKSLHLHLAREHRDEMAAMPPEFFTPAGVSIRLSPPKP